MNGLKTHLWAFLQILGGIIGGGIALHFGGEFGVALSVLCAGFAANALGQIFLRLGIANAEALAKTATDKAMEKVDELLDKLLKEKK